MTCIVGMLDKKNNKVYLGGDSLGSNGYSKTVYTQKKVFHSKDTKELIIGLCGRFNFQALEYENLLDELTLMKDNISREYLITKFIPNLKTIANKYNCNKTNSGRDELEGSLLFGYKDVLFQIQSDYSLIESTDGYLAVGSGGELAIGSLATTYDNKDMTIVEKMHKALQVSSKHGCGIEAPFYIINTSDDEIIEFKE